MSLDLLSKWLGFWSPLSLGQFANPRANGLGLTAGVFWVRVAGGYNLYRWSGQKLPVEADRIVGAAEAAATSIGNFPYVGHQASTCYWYLLRAVGAGGVEEGNCQQVVRAEFDDSGELVGPQPNRPQDLSVRPLAGGSFELRWTYSAEGQEVAPAVFEVFTDGGTGQVDYETPVGSVSYRAGRVHYRWTGGAFGHGMRVRWAVRARSASGVTECNEVVVQAWSDAVGPERPEPVLAEPGQESR